MAQSDTRTRIKPAEDFKEPPMYRVVYLNDNQTTYEFVVETLVQYFDYTADTAHTITASALLPRPPPLPPPLLSHSPTAVALR